MSTAHTQSPGSPSTQSRRSDTVEINRAEEGHKQKQLELATFVTSDPNAKDINDDGALLSDTENVLYGGCFSLARATTTRGHQNNESEEPQARALGADLASGSPDVDNAAGENSDRDAQENSGAKADLTCVYPGVNFSKKSLISYPDQLPPEVAEYKKSLALALQVGAVSTALIASVSATILQTYRSNDNWDPEEKRYVYLDLSSFGSIILNITATLKASILVRKLGELGESYNLDKQRLVCENSRKRVIGIFVWLPKVPNDIGGWFGHLQWNIIECESQRISK
ncbi:hypothetical protein PM082_018213 [Marasmius tenuissimus]|nr:hypothetical protein PM082_018213 [Marasmius tenuissimus]